MDRKCHSVEQLQLYRIKDLSRSSSYTVSPNETNVVSNDSIFHQNLPNTFQSGDATPELGNCKSAQNLQQRK